MVVLLLVAACLADVMNVGCVRLPGSLCRLPYLPGGGAWSWQSVDAPRGLFDFSISHFSTPTPTTSSSLELPGGSQSIRSFAEDSSPGSGSV